ncbi:hypothetical protein GGX14DRAFT_473804 [Mycena pura]|uniref:DUF829-domain-containing protein n=1 Tax=Mycena pura TaxID=153505 RepID=A0AAD6UWJ6_9AGAR|nr:hypothetical protein GGX14DRAFT_473804 [Mycena pura]
MADSDQQLRGPVQVSDICYYLPSQESQSEACAPEDPQYRRRTDRSPARLPRLIFIFGWASAGLSHLLKYSRQYTAFFPSASQLIIQCDLTAMALGTTETNVRRQGPVVEQLERLGLFTEQPPRMLIHVFSSGGAAQLLWLALAIDRMPPPPNNAHPLLACLILDSTPTPCQVTDFQRGLAGASTGPAKLAASTISTVVYTAAQLLAAISLRPALRPFVRHGLNNPRLFPWINTTTPRLYLYSDADAVARVSSVREHIARARAAGLNVREVRFEKSPHVLHARVYPEQYWAAVSARWRDAVRAKL